MKIAPLAPTAAEALERAFPLAPYLSRLAERTDGAFERIKQEGAAAAFEAAIASIEGAGGEDAEALLRLAKRAAHLAIAGADLSGEWALRDVTQAMTRLADASVEAALRTAGARRGVKTDGLFAIALGKMGAGELNYSSDIDIAVFYDSDVFDGGEAGAPKAASKIAQDVVQLLDTRTSDGYVFRTDLRLRPDPSSTPLAVSTRMAEGYYESVGQNWERMVWIKARPCAGDIKRAEAFLETMTPFVWRRHMDYWAIADIHAIKRMINAEKNAAELERADPDVKLAPGGIREIEFFAQTQQIILGGRSPKLRKRGTLEALSALNEAGIVEDDTLQELTAYYENLRHIEHRIQMREDQQTHKLPPDPENRMKIAQLCGIEDLGDFDGGLLAIRKSVHDHYYSLFGEEERRSGAQGNLVFTGVDDDPGTVKTLEGLGFTDPSSVIERIRQWHRGGTAATRTSRGRELLTALLPELLQAMGETGDPATAFVRFSAFFDRLRSGVQTLSMLLAEAELLDELVTTLAIAPRLSETLGRRPELLEALLDGGVTAPAQANLDDFEEAMNECRRRHRDETFLIGHRLLHGRLAARDGAQAWTRLAEDTVISMAGAAAREMERRFGPPPGDWSVFAMGRLGAGDMTAGSDLDLMVVYEPHEEGQSGAQSWFTRFTQRLITALSAPTGEGDLYEVDMRLRPSGNSGPVAVKFSAFETYQRNEAWTWEHMALTRIRAIAGDEALGRRVEKSAHAAIIEKEGGGDRLEDIRDMRLRLHKEKPGKGDWDLKLDAGGLVDIEFIAQKLMLETQQEALISPNTSDALAALIEAGPLERADGEALIAALEYRSALLQVLRLAVGTGFSPETATPSLKSRLARAVDEEDFASVETKLTAHKTAVRALVSKFLHI